MKTILFGLLVILVTRIDAQEDSTRHVHKSGNFGPSITAGPEIQLLYPNLLNLDVELRYWLRIINWDKLRTFDHTLLVSPGVTYGNKEVFFRLRLGDLINVNIHSITSVKLGVNTELLLNRNNSVWSVQTHIGKGYRRLYYYIGVSHPFHATETDLPFRTNMIFGIKVGLYSSYTYVN